MDYLPFAIIGTKPLLTKINNKLHDANQHLERLVKQEEEIKQKLNLMGRLLSVAEEIKTAIMCNNQEGCG